MVKYEYTILAPENVQEGLETLNKHGEVGWKVVGQYVDGTDQPIIILMRKKQWSQWN